MPATSSNDLLSDAVHRIGETVHHAARGLGEDDLAYRPVGKGPETAANSIAWLLWHSARVMDSQLATMAGQEEVWDSNGWAAKFDLPLEDRDSTGYGHSSQEVAMVRASESLLTGYYDAVQRRMLSYLGNLKEADYDEIADPSYDPPVTRAVRLVSIINDCTQHVGQATYVRGLLS